MKFVLFVALAVAVRAQTPTSEPADRLCHCSLGAHTLHHNAELYNFSSLWETECDDEADSLCREECKTARDVYEAAGNWTVFLTKENDMLGNIACSNLGKDEAEGLQTKLYHAVCDRPTQHSGHGFEEPLCCADGLYTPCPQ